MREISKHIIWDNYFKFAFVRNPFERLVSEYFWRLKNNHLHGDTVFPDFVENVVSKEYTHDKHLMPQYLFVTNTKKEIIVNRIGKFESMTEDFESIMHSKNLFIKLPVVHKSKKYDYRDYYDNETLRIVTDIYSEDLNLFNYRY
jgi:hypothetical protein